MAGGVLGLAVAFVGLEVFTTMNPDALWGSSLIGVDLRVAAFAAFVSVGTAVLFGLLPLLRTIGDRPDERVEGLLASHHRRQRDAAIQEPASS